MEFDTSVESGHGNQQNEGQGQGQGRLGAEGRGLSQGGDIREYLASLENETRSARAESAQAREYFQKMASVFSGEEEKDDRDPTEVLLDQILEAAYESDKAGQGGMPFTVQLAQHLASSQKQLKALNAKLAEIEGRNRQLASPHHQHDQQAYMAIDNLITDAITDRVGVADVQMEEAVGKKIVAEIQSLQKEDPDAWNKVRKSPKLQQRLVEHFVEQSIPKHLRALEREAVDMATDITLDEANSAIEEAKMIKDPTLRAKAIEIARQAKWEVQFSGRGRR